MKIIALILLPLTVGACATAPLIPICPTVKVSRLDSLLITPEAISFQAKVVINNQMRGDLNIETGNCGSLMNLLQSCAMDRLP